MEQTETKIETLRRQIARCDVESVLRIVANFLALTKGDLLRETDLTSPVRRLFKGGAATCLGTA